MMDRYLKIAIIVVTVIALIAVGLSVNLFMLMSRDRIEKDNLRDKTVEVLKEKKKLTEEIDELKLTKADAERQKDAITGRYDSLNAQYEIEKSQNNAVRLEINRKQEEIKSLNAKLRLVAKEKSKIQNMLEEEKTKYGRLKDRVNKLVEVKDVLENKVKDIINRQGVELERIVVKSEGELEGKVLVVNRKYNFVVVDLGFSDDLSLGDVLTIFRSGKYVGEAQIEKIYDSMAAATIAREIKPGAIMVSDSVVVKSD